MPKINRLFYNASLVFLCVQIFFTLYAGASYCEPQDAASEDNDWSAVSSNYFTIYYRPDANLYGIERELTARALNFDQAARYGNMTVLDEICLRLDKLFSRVKELLNMYPKIPKVVIKIFKDRQELGDEYCKIFSKKDDPKAYYVKDYNTIYTSEADIADSVVTHEMAHVIIDHYFEVVPPEKVSEILASYVDAHIED